MRTLTLSITQFNNYVKQIIDAEEFLYNVAVFGEVTNFKKSGANYYFDLKDENAMLSCIKFGELSSEIKNGDMVTVFGRVNFYVKSGRLNFVASKIEPYGLGELYQKFLILKETLEKEGIFDQSIKKEIPKFAKNIGVVTSETGAVVRDIINVTRKKNKMVNLHIFPAKVQGANAEDTIIAGLRYFETRDDVDTVIIARGGGSFEDLAPFNTEKLAREIFVCKKPIISAVGHETDFSICDFASDLRVPTPSVAAEVAVFDERQMIENIKSVLRFEYDFLNSKIDASKKSISDEEKTILSSVALKIKDYKLLTKTYCDKIKNLAVDKFKVCETKVLRTCDILSKLNPLEILKNGYSVIEKDGKKLNSVAYLKKDDKIDITFNDGSAVAVIETIKGGK